MNLLTLLLILVAIGIVLYFLSRATFLDAWIQLLIKVVLIAVAIWMVLDFFGVVDALRGVRGPG